MIEIFIIIALCFCVLILLYNYSWIKKDIKARDKLLNIEEMQLDRYNDFIEMLIEFSGNDSIKAEIKRLKLDIWNIYQAYNEQMLRIWLDRKNFSCDFYKNRCDELQKVQKTFRDPERKMVCDILANGTAN